MEKIFFEREREISPSDVFWLNKAGDKICSAVELVERALKGQNEIYRLSGDIEGVFVLSAQGEKLSIEGFAGKGFIKHFGEIYKQLRLLAAVRGLTCLSGEVRRKGIEELYRKHTKAERVSALWEEKLL